MASFWYSWPMDRATLKDILALAEQQIAEGLETIAKQRAAIANLEGERRYTRAAEELIKECESFKAQLLTPSGQSTESTCEP